MSMKAYRTKEDAFLIVFVVEEKNYLFLLDLWKAGLLEMEEFENSLQSYKNENLGMPELELHEIDKEEALRLIRQGAAIRSVLKREFPDELTEWLENHGIEEYRIDGSLYKCFNCETGNLEKEEVKEILQIARQELRKGIIGSDKEKQYFYICATCKGEMHESHT